MTKKERKAVKKATKKSEKQAQRAKKKKAKSKGNGKVWETEYHTSSSPNPTDDAADISLADAALE